MRALATLLSTSNCKKVWIYKDQENSLQPFPGRPSKQPWDNYFSIFNIGEYGDPYNAWDDGSGYNDYYGDGKGTSIKELIKEYAVYQQIVAP